MNKRGQSALEVTIFGIMLIIILYGMVSYGQRLSYQQQTKMSTFRAALNRAYKNNGVANYLNRHNDYVISTEGYFRGRPVAVDSTASVLWQKGISGSYGTTDEQASTYLESSKDFKALSTTKPIDTVNRKYLNFDGTNRTLKTPYEIWKEDKLLDEAYELSTSKQESASGINYNRVGVLEGSAEDTFHFAVTSENYVYNPNAQLNPRYEFNQGKATLYTTQSRGDSKSWQTPHD
jgi:hypothetical protein